MQFTRGVCCFGDGAHVGPCDQNHRGLRRVAQGVECGLEAHFLHLQARVRPQAGRTAIVAAEKPGPGLGKTQQAQGVPRRRRVEDDVVVARGIVGQEGRELVERSNLRGAGAGQLLTHGREFLGAGVCAHLRDHPLAIGLGGVVGVDVQHRQARRAGHGNRRVAKLDPEHLVQVRCSVGADQQHLLARVREHQRGGGRRRSLADAALAGEEQMPGRVVQKPDGTRLQPGLHFLARGKAAAVHDLAVDHDGRRGAHP